MWSEVERSGCGPSAGFAAISGVRREAIASPSLSRRYAAELDVASTLAALATRATAALAQLDDIALPSPDARAEARGVLARSAQVLAWAEQFRAALHAFVSPSLRF